MRILSLFAMFALLPFANAAPKNVVMIVTDDQGPDFGCYGNPVMKTPHLDQLARDGVRFTDAFVTTASCSPSRAVLLTGMHNHTNGQYGLAHASHKFTSYPNVKSLPVMMADAGYRTVNVGKTHVEPAEAYRFQTTLKANARNPVEMAEKCRPVVTAESDKPFFLYFCPVDPHRDGAVVEGDPLKPNSFGNKVKGVPGVEEVRYDPKEVIVPPFLPDTPSCRAELAQYYQSCSRIDQGIGRLIAILREAKKLDDTLILFLSDHGIPFPGAKTTVYDSGLRIPLIIRHPEAKARGITNDAMVSMIDLMPTILDYAAALPKQSKLQGRSILPILEQEHPKGWDRIDASHTFHEVTMYYPMRAVRTRDYKLIWNIAHPLPFPFASDLFDSATWQNALTTGPDTAYGKRTVKSYTYRPEFELYHLTNDPDEVKNLANDQKNKQKFDELLAELKAFQTRTNDPWKIKWEHE